MLTLTTDDIHQILTKKVGKELTTRLLDEYRRLVAIEAFDEALSHGEPVELDVRLDSNKIYTKPKTLPKCTFVEAWIGRCNHPEAKYGLCDKHLRTECWKNGCKNRVVATCGHTSQFVCGTPYCAEHKHHADG